MRGCVVGVEEDGERAKVFCVVSSLDYRRFCFSVGKADVPYAAVGQVAPALGMGGPFA